MPDCIMRALYILFFIIIIATPYLLCKYYILHRITNNTRWCVTAPTSDLIDAIGKTSPEIYRLTNYTYPDSSYDDFKKIIRVYKEFVTQEFFPKKEIIKYYAKLSEQDFFRITFFLFLHFNCGKSEIDGNIMRKYNTQIDKYSTKYNLSDFGVFYHKLYLILTLFASKFVSKKNVPHLLSIGCKTLIPFIEENISTKSIIMEVFDPRDKV